MTAVTSVITVEGIEVDVVYKDVANLYIRIRPPDGRVRVSAPRRFGEDRVRQAVADRRDWIRRHQARIRSAHPDVAARLTSGDVIHLWGVPHRLEGIPATARPRLMAEGGRLPLARPRGATQERRRVLLDDWLRDRLRGSIAGLIPPWEARMGVTVPRVTIRRMTTRWGSCSLRTRRITLNLDLVTRDPACLEYVIVHEMAHYFEPGHGRSFQTLMDRLLPDWRERRALLNGG